MRKMLLFLLIIATAPSYSLAKDAIPTGPKGSDAREITEALKDCDRPSGELGIQNCAWGRYEQEQLKYSAAAREVDKALSADAEGRALLVKANRAFEKFRQAACAFDSRGPGSMAGSLLYGCLQQYTHRRARALKAYARCEKTGHCQVPNLLYIDENENEPLAKRR